MAAWLQSHVLGTEVTCERCRHRWVFTQGAAQPPRESFGEADVDRTLGEAVIDRLGAGAADDDALDERDARFDDDDSGEKRASLWDADDRPPPRH